MRVSIFALIAILSLGVLLTGCPKMNKVDVDGHCIVTDDCKAGLTCVAYRCKSSTGQPDAGKDANVSDTATEDVNTDQGTGEDSSLDSISPDGATD